MSALTVAPGQAGSSGRTTWAPRPSPEGRVVIEVAS
jgi:hypothetical protein